MIRGYIWVGLAGKAPGVDRATARLGVICAMYAPPLWATMTAGPTAKLGVIYGKAGITHSALGLMQVDLTVRYIQSLHPL